MNNKISQLVCRVCGKIQSDPPWGLDGQCPTYEICDCCGVEFGYGDCTPEAARAWRKHWIEPEPSGNTQRKDLLIGLLMSK